MGRRFQTYYIYDGETEDKKIGFHMQVCCGDDTICLLEQVLSFFKKHMQYSYNSLSKPQYDFDNKIIKLLDSLNNVIPKNGVFLNTKKLSDPCIDPLKVDNNDGIFIVDLRNNKIKYCLMNYEFKIVTPSEYFKIYEHEYTEKDEILKEIPSLIENIEKFETITLNELNGIYPTIAKINI